MTDIRARQRLIYHNINAVDLGAKSGRMTDKKVTFSDHIQIRKVSGKYHFRAKETVRAYFTKPRPQIVNLALSVKI